MTTIRGGSYPVISDYEDSFFRYHNDRLLNLVTNDTNSHRTLFVRSKRQSTQPPKILLSDEEQASAIAEEDELKRDQEAKHNHRYNHPSSTTVNPTMLDKTSIHKFA